MKLTGKTIVVTGGAGFIGSHLVEALLQNNRVIVYDNFSSNVLNLSDLRNLRPLGDLQVIKGDILDEKKLSHAMTGADVVFHLAVACVRLSLSQEIYVHTVNATGTLTALLAAKKARVRRFVYISSSEVYGATHGATIRETDPVTPTTVYGMSKYMGELYAGEFTRHEGLPCIIVRPFNAYGPRSHFDGVYGEVIPRFAIRALNGLQPTVFGTGKQTRDFTYVTDTAAGIIRAAECDVLVGDVVNIAYGREISVSRLGRLINEEAGLSYQPIILPARPNDIDRLAAGTAKARKLLRFVPGISIQTGIPAYVRWLRGTYPDTKKLLKKIPQTNW